MEASIDFLSPKRECSTVLRKINFELNSGEITWLLGPSGAGKTTLLRLLGGDKKVGFTGDIIYCYKNQELRINDIVKQGQIGLFIPDGGLPPWMKVEELFYLPSNFNNQLKKPKCEDIDQALSILCLPPSTKDKIPSQLSLGMRYRVLLSLAFLYNPCFCFVDEIFNALDQPIAELLIQELQGRVKINNSICLITTHDIDRALSIPGSYYYKNLKTDIIKINDPKKDDLYSLFKDDYK